MPVKIRARLSISTKAQKMAHCQKKEFATGHNNVLYMKTCPTCNQQKPCNAFGKNSSRKDGMSSQCKSCRNTYFQSDSYRNRRRVYYCNRLGLKYGLKTPYSDMLTKQNNSCAICKKPPTTTKRLSIDHCHKTGDVRGLLCQNCNLMLGLACDDATVLRQAIAYLNKNGPIA